MSEVPIRVTLVRHGQSEANRVQRWQGQGDSPLSALGREQARCAGRRLAKRRFTRIVASDLSRAVDTARAIGTAFTCDRSFREFDVGNWEGLTREEVAARYPEEMERLKQGEDVPLGGGESYAAFSQRIDAAFAALRAELAPGDHALVVCHGGVIATALSGALGLRSTRTWSLARVANTSITELSFSPRGVLVNVFNDTLHLLSHGSWPSHGEVGAVVGLVCGTLPAQGLGEFAAHYDATPELAALGEDPEPQRCATVLASTLTDLQARHPGQRVSLAAHGRSIHAWAEEALFRGAPREGALLPPAQGSICHVGRSGERPLLLDYGLSAAEDGLT